MVLFVSVQLPTVSVPELAMPPPSAVSLRARALDGVVAEVAVEDRERTGVQETAAHVGGAATAAGQQAVSNRQPLEYDRGGGLDLEHCAGATAADGNLAAARDGDDPVTGGLQASSP